MSEQLTAEVKQLGSRLYEQLKDPTVRAPMTAKHERRQVITKILVSAAIVVGFFVGGAAPASADPNSIGNDPNPISGLTCSCRETAPAGSPALREEINRGIRSGLSASVPGLPAPAHPSQLRP
jgi:hypothetical protein